MENTKKSQDDLIVDGVEPMVVGDELQYVTNIVSLFDAEVDSIENFDALVVSINTNGVIESEGVFDEDLEGYVAFMERVRNGEVILTSGDSLIFKVDKNIEKSLSGLKDRGVDYVICMVSPEWNYGLHRNDTVGAMERGLQGLLNLAADNDITSIAISNIYPYLPNPLVMYMLYGFLKSSYMYFIECCILRCKEGEGVYNLNLFHSAVTSDEDKTIENVLYRRNGGNLESDLIIKL